MSDASAPILQLDIDVAGGDDFDLHLEPVLATLRDQSLHQGIRCYRMPPVDGRQRRSLTIRFLDEAGLQSYLETDADGLLEQLTKALGEHARIESRVLRPQDDEMDSPTDLSRCLNCNAILTGQYCGSCGQRASDRLISLWALLKEAFGDLFELDSRLWRTLLPLALRPGRLTRDYLSGRRARYMPPFRMYLVLSLAFFVIAFFDPQEELGILFAEEVTESATADTVAAEIDTQGDGETAAATTPLEDADLNLQVDFGDGMEEVGNCELEDYDVSESPEWVARRFTKERVQAACRNIVGADGSGWQTFTDGIIENMPAGLFVLLPLMALVLKLLYPLSRRYYVEHLLFVIHYHSFAFLTLTLEILLSRSFRLLNLPDGLDELLGVAAGIYIPVYLYRSLRHVYTQSHLLTLPKFVVLTIVYLIGFGLIMLVAGLLSAFSV